MSRHKYVGHKRRLVTEDEYWAIRESTKTNAEVAREYGYHPSTISRIRSGR